MNPASRLPGLDGLRAVAILAVMFHHFGGSPQFPRSNLLSAIASQGNFGVRLFFVLSGFLITSVLLNDETRQGRISLGRFYTRRAFRILPPAVAYLAVVALLAGVGLVQTSPGDLASAALFVRNLVYPSFGPAMTAHYWSLAIEEQFYLIWPTVLLLTPARHRVAIAAAGLILAPCWRQVAGALGIGEQLCVTRTDLHFDALLAGCLLALLRADARYARWLLARPLAHPGVPLVALGLTCLYLFTPLPPVARNLLSTVVLVSLAATINYLLVAPRSTLLSRVLNARPVVAIGQLSYGLYLWQQLFLYGYHESYPWYRHLPWNVALTALFAVGSYRALELPALRLRERVEGWWALRGTAGARL